MDFITRIRTLRAIERAAHRYGFQDDSTLDRNGHSNVGTMSQQEAIIAVGLESGVSFFSLSTRDQEWVNQLLESCVLGTRQRNLCQNSVKSSNTTPARKRAW